MGTKSRFHSESIFKFILLFLGLVIIIASLQYGIGTIKQPGTGAFTLVLGVLILLSGAIHIILARSKSETHEPIFESNSEMKKFASLGFILVLWVIGMPYLGYILMTFVITLVMSKVIQLEGWLKPILLSLITSAFIYLLFDYWLYIDLPRGILG